MKTPDFWYREPGATARLLAPTGWIYGAASWLRRQAVTPRHVDIPVLCVGNLVAGGAGKTPVALALHAALGDPSVHFVTRGYGGKEPGPLAVDAARHDAEQIGDEALLLAEAAPTWVSRDRVAGARAAVRAGASALILDDGFQNPHLHKDLSVLVVDGYAGIGNGRLVPAGPLREPVAWGLARAQAVVVVGPDEAGVARIVGGRRPVLHVTLQPDAEARTLAGRRVVAFAGLGRPEKFFTTLRNLGADVVEAVGFPDHHPYPPIEISRLSGLAERHDAMLVTTAKDSVRLPGELQSLVTVVRIAAVWHEPEALRALLDRVRPGAPRHGA